MQRRVPRRGHAHVNTVQGLSGGAVGNLPDQQGEENGMKAHLRYLLE
jgi:hypothetical protein